MKAHQVLSTGVILGLLSISAHIYSDTRTVRIVGGEESKSATYPWMVSLQNKTEGDHFCGASLVADRWVLSASHCHEGEPLESLFAVVGEYDLKNSDAGQKRVGIKRIIKADSLPSGDMMLLELTEPVTNTTVSLADEALMASLKTGDMLKVMGWGNNAGDNSEDFPVKLHEVDVPLYDKEECKQAYNAIGEEVDDTNMCAGYKLGGKDSCQGDSGGPLVLQYNGKWHQAGVVSFGEGCALANYPGVYTRVATFNQWIKEKISQAEGLSISDTNLGLVGVDSELNHSLILTNNGNTDLSIQGMVLRGTTGYQVNSDQCTASVLKPKQTCIVALKTQFSELGKQTTALQVSTSDSSHPQWDYGITAEILPKAAFSETINNGLNWYVDKKSQWILEDDADKTLTSVLNYENYETLLMAQVSGDGALNFEWKLGTIDDVILELYIDGKKVKGDATEIYSVVTQTLPEGEHRIEWRLLDNTETGLSSDVKAHIKSVSFKRSSQTESSNKVSGSKKSSGGGSAGMLLPLLFLLLLGRKKLIIRGK